MLYLQVIFTILSAICIAALIPVGAFLGWVWAGVCAISAFLFFMLMRVCKQNRDANEPQSTEETSKENE